MQSFTTYKMPSINQIKIINSLATKKHRNKHNLYVAEGEKLVKELLLYKSSNPLWIFCTKDFHLNEFNKEILSKVEIVSYDDLKKISFVQTPNKVVGVFYQTENHLSIENLKNELSLCLDTVQDPGNMGTIIRIADWFGIKNIICSKETSDIYNPKVVQATMGAITRVNVFYTNLLDFIPNYIESTNNPVYGTFLNGENIYTKKLFNKGLIIMGNEGNGISSEIEKLVTDKLLIPSFSSNQEKSESLNVGIATGIICSEFKKNSFF